MDRRNFILRTGLVAAGSAFAWPLVDCELEYGPPIPCLSVVPEPIPEAGMTYIRASQIGCALDCDLRTGHNKYKGGHATDDGPLINAAMSSASASNPMTLIIDGSAMISGLFLPAGGYWSIAGLGCGTGFYIKTGTNNDGIHNGGPTAGVPTDPGPPVPPRGSNVSLRNFAMNGNAGSGSDGDSTSGKTQGLLEQDVFYMCINLMNLDNIVIENIAAVNSPSFHIRLSNVGNVTVSGCVFQSHGPNTDGLHFDGPANDITISSCQFTTGDDAIALNCPEGHMGNISRVSIANCTFNSWTLLRLETLAYSGSNQQFIIDSVVVNNCSGTFTHTPFLIGQGLGSNPNSLASLLVSNCSLTAPCVLDVGASFGSIVLTNVVFIPLNTDAPPGFAFLRTSRAFPGYTYTGSSVSFNNCAISRSSNLEVAALILEYGSQIQTVTFTGFAMQDAGAYPAANELIGIASGTIGSLVINALNSKDIKAPASPSGFSSIQTVSGAGVLATGWEFPDAVMANEVPYISASTGLPSIKIAGVVEPYE